MESNDASLEGSDSAVARAALDGVADARGRVAARMRSPWWYYPGIGLSLGFAFASASISRDLVGYAVPVCLATIPVLLTLLANRVTGVRIENWNIIPPSVRRPSYIWMLLLAGLLAVGLVLELALHLRWSMAGCGVLVFVLTILMGRRIDQGLVRDVQAGR